MKSPKALKEAMLMKFSGLMLIIAFFFACGPARSDIFVEQVNPELVSRLVSSAVRQTNIFPDSGKTTHPLWVRGIKLYFNDSLKSTTLWYDEQGRVTGMIEYEGGRLKDSVEFFPNGQRMFSLLFNTAGQPSGPARYFYEDGRVREDGRFDEGKKSGIWRHFYPDGRLEETHEYDRYGNLKR